MKAVYYHADSHFAWGGSPGDVYKRHAQRFKDQCHKFGMQVIHLTCDGHPQWGDENYSYPLDPKNIVANREEAFTSFLETAPDDWYWFAEPDFLQFHKMKDPKDCDAVFLYRGGGDTVPMTPCWRMATPKALPVFKRLRDEMRKESAKDWHGDSYAFTRVWHEMGKPSGNTTYLGCKLEFRCFGNYVKPGIITSNLLGMRKLGRG